MTEKVVSLSGGLVLGMVFTLFLGIGATNTITQPLHFEVPAVMQMTLAQVSSSTAAPSNSTTPAPTSTSPSSSSTEDQGRITRIATVTETTDPVFSNTTAATDQTTPKNWNIASTPKIENSLQSINLQHSNTPSNPQTYASVNIAHTSGHGNFTAIADNSPGSTGFYSGQTPSFVDGKPQTHGSPATVQDDPGESEGEKPAVSEEVPASIPDPDTFENDNSRRHIDPIRPDHTFTLVSDSNNGPDRPDAFQDQRHRPETD